MIVLDLFEVIQLCLSVLVGVLFVYIFHIASKLQYKRRKFLREHLLKEDYNEYCKIGNEDYEKD